MPIDTSIQQLTGEQLRQVYKQALEGLANKGVFYKHDRVYAVFDEVRRRDVGYEAFFKLLQKLAEGFDIKFPTPDELLRNKDFKFDCEPEDLTAFFKSASRFLNQFQPTATPLAVDTSTVDNSRAAGFDKVTYNLDTFPDEPSIFGNMGNPSRAWIAWHKEKFGGGELAAQETGRWLLERLESEPPRKIEVFSYTALGIANDNGWPSMRLVIGARYSGEPISTWEAAHTACLKLYKQGTLK